MTRTTALGFFAIANSIIFAVVAIVPRQPRPWTVGAAAFVGFAALLALLITLAPKAVEWFQRHRLRKLHGLNQKHLMDRSCRQVGFTPVRGLGTR